MIELPVPDVLAAARAAGIVRVVTVATDLESARWSAHCADQHDAVYAAVAIHPNDTEAATAPSPASRDPRAPHAAATAPSPASRASHAAAPSRDPRASHAAASAPPAPPPTAAEVLAEIEALARLPRVVAVGETGLDYYRDHAAPDVQRWWFREHIKIAKRTGKALMIHDREAHADVLRILAEEGPPPRVVFHCFSGDVAMVKQCAEAGYVMSFAGNVTFANAQPLRDAAAAAPPDLLLAETDAPFLTPVPNRGRPNAPAQVAYTLRCLAEVQGLDLAELCDVVTATADRTFGPW
jgi:TatD DNase family protein